MNICEYLRIIKGPQMTQKLMAELFEVTIPTINEHLKNIFASGELTKNATVRNFRTVQRDGNRDVERGLDFYNLNAMRDL